MLKDDDFDNCCRFPGSWSSYETEIYTALEDLLGISADIIEALARAQEKDDLFALHLEIAAFGRALKKWKTALPPRLRWDPMNVKQADHRFFHF